MGLFNLGMELDVKSARCQILPCTGLLAKQKGPGQNQGSVHSRPPFRICCCSAGCPSEQGQMKNFQRMSAPKTYSPPPYII